MNIPVTYYYPGDDNTRFTGNMVSVISIKTNMNSTGAETLAVIQTSEGRFKTIKLHLLTAVNKND